jgi:hypothetical protein
VDVLDRLYVQCTTAATSADSAVQLDADPSTTQNVYAVFGWAPGGESVRYAPLVAPTAHSIADGWPLIADFGPGTTIVLGDRESRPRGNIKDDITLVEVDLTIMVSEPNGRYSRTRERIQAAARAVREVLFSDAGRTLDSTVHLVLEQDCKIPGKPVQLAAPSGSVSPVFDVAVMKWQVQVYERFP